LEKKDYSQFFGQEWARLLDSFLHSKEYKFIGQELVRQKSLKNVEITPKFSDIFRAFLECPYWKMSTLILGQDVYPNKNPNGTYVADGIAFSAKENKSVPVSLQFIHDAIDESVYNGDYAPMCTFNHDTNECTHDLKYLANSGILLVNCAYTTIVGAPGAHLTLWAPFTKFLISAINEHKDSIGVILIGTSAKSYKPLFTNKTFKILECEHPAAALYKKRKWEHNNVFKDLTDWHKKTNNIQINW